MPYGVKYELAAESGGEYEWYSACTDVDGVDEEAMAGKTRKQLAACL